MKANLDYYKILDVTKTVSQEEIKHAFRIQAKKYHPDTTTDEKEKQNLEEQFKLVNEAYEVLGDVDKRQTYDNPIPHFNMRPMSGVNFQEIRLQTPIGIIVLRMPIFK